MRLFACIALTFVLFGCGESDKKETTEQKEEIVYDMYEPSEMAILMNQMYEHNMKVKQDILEGKTPTQFPMDFLKIHSAEMTKASDRNETFESFSKLFIATEKEIFNDESTVDVKERFNNAVNLCVACHQTSCTGPIPRIKKLLIN